RGLDESLQRLKTEVIDIMQLHNPSIEECESGKLVEALQEMKKQGKVRFIANTRNGSPKRPKRASAPSFAAEWRRANTAKATTAARIAGRNSRKRGWM